jgi:hypothetical protein
VADDELGPFFFSIDEIPAYSIAEMLEPTDVEETEKQRLYSIFGRDLLTKVILQSPNLSVYHENAKPGETVKRHRHGTHQITYVLRGSLHYGNRVTTAGMGYYSPNTPYAWTAGDDGAEWIEIHAGQPEAFAE